MPRPLRIEFPNAWYHVMNRGAGRQSIYRTIKHRDLFLAIVAEASRLFGIEVHSYCLMDNHYHMLIKTPRGNLSRAMRHINGVYTQQYNRLMKKDGALFRGRYKAIIVGEDDYLLQVSRYIHLNPVISKIVKLPSQWRWSSYQCYLGEKSSPDWLQTKEITAMLDCKMNVDAYRKFVETGLDIDTKNFYEKMNTPIIFGTTIFKEKLLGSLDKQKIKASQIDYNRTHKLPSLNQIEIAVANHFNLNKKELLKSHRGLKNHPRKIVIYGSRFWGSVKLSMLARRYHCEPQNISNIVSDIKKKIDTDKALEKMIGEIKKSLTDELLR